MGIQDNIINRTLENVNTGGFNSEKFGGYDNKSFGSSFKSFEGNCNNIFGGSSSNNTSKLFGSFGFKFWGYKFNNILKI